mgnify:CR=1 FL=1
MYTSNTPSAFGTTISRGMMAESKLSMVRSSSVSRENSIPHRPPKTASSQSQGEAVLYYPLNFNSLTERRAFPHNLFRAPAGSEPVLSRHPVLDNSDPRTAENPAGGLREARKRLCGKARITLLSLLFPQPLQMLRQFLRMNRLLLSRVN